MKRSGKTGFEWSVIEGGKMQRLSYRGIAVAYICEHEGMWGYFLMAHNGTEGLYQARSIATPSDMDYCYHKPEGARKACLAHCRREMRVQTPLGVRRAE